LRLFQAFGVELEYMIVDADTLDVRPIADELLRDAAGTAEYVGEVETEDVCWSNELVAHVVELKTAEPAPALRQLAGQFSAHVARINQLLTPRGARLMPGGMHPWMDPARETTLWAHDYNEVYEAFDRIFGCSGHGWSNLQSAHLNLPFGDDDEFGRLHAAIRLVLPILPALAAASPIVEGAATGLLDTRLDVYRTNCGRIGSISGLVVPEAVFSGATYESEIFARIYADIAPHDPEGTLRHEWLNARGAIARFERSAIEVRVLDTQECPAADLAVIGLAAGALRSLVAERTISYAEQQTWSAERLAAILQQTIREGERATIDDASYLRAFGVVEARCAAGELWRRQRQSLDEALDLSDQSRAALDVILDQGPLARRVLRALGADSGSAAPAQARFDCEPLRAVYARLADCLARGAVFVP
jgi:gamma-glutamyl:cysteine ligase YbdK (ATP-grasp superfamily)